MAIAPYGYAYEKLLGAMEIMATGKGSRQERLARAGKSYILPIRSPKMHNLPPDLAASLDSLYRDLTAVPPPTQWDNAFDATARKMSWQKAERLPLFSRISLMRCMKEFKRMGIAAEYCFIPDVSPKSDGKTRKRKKKGDALEAGEA